MGQRPEIIVNSAKDFLTKFETHADYEAYINGSDKVLPNVSYCVNENEVHYNPYTDPMLIIKINVTTTSEPTNIMSDESVNPFDGVVIDGVEQPSVVSSYTFDSIGEHTIKFLLADPLEIGECAFQNCRNVTWVSIPDSVTVIGNNAFRECSLTSVKIPDSVTTIDFNAFMDCTSLTKVVIGNGVTEIGEASFLGCTSLANVKFGNSVTVIGVDAFNGCSALTSIVIPDNILTIDDNAFMNCHSLKRIVLGSGITSIGESAFKQCSALVIIDSLATTAPRIQEDTFQGAKTGGRITVPSGSTGYDVWMGTGDYYLGKYNWNIYN